MLDRLVQPLVGSIYTADVERLSLAAAMPRFRQMEQLHGSLIRAMLSQRRDRSYEGKAVAGGARFASLQGGMSSLVEALARTLPASSVELESPVDRVTPLAGRRWMVSIGGGRPRECECDGVIIATPAYRAAAMLAEVDDEAARALAEIEYVSSAVVSLGYRRYQIGHPLNGSGFVVPLTEQRTILSCSFSSQKYEGRAADGDVLLRVFIGGACQSGLLRLSSDELVTLAEREVVELLDISGKPLLRRVVRHHRAMPQYHVGHAGQVEALSRRLARFPTLALAGSAYGGVGLPTCIQSGQTAAERLAKQLSASENLSRRILTRMGSAV
jgi:oxygen-dependent protoporphyrinogen oxidase